MKILFFIFLLVSLGNTYAYETDQYTATFHREKIKDSTDTLDHIVNEAISVAVERWEGKRDDDLMALSIGGQFYRRQLEYWANISEKISSWKDPADSIFKNVGYRNSLIIRLKGAAPTIRVNNVLLGVDKLSHFFGVGWVYYRVADINNAGFNVEKRTQMAIKKGVKSERGKWGELTTRVYSNADMVTNYEGLLFYRSLKKDYIISGKKAIIGWKGNKPFVQRKFTFKDHVSDFWSEALLPSTYKYNLRLVVRGTLRTYCLRNSYLENKSLFDSQNYEELKSKYSNIGVRYKEAEKFNLNSICRKFDNFSSSRKKRIISFQKALSRHNEKKAKKENLRPDTILKIGDNLPKEIKGFFPYCKKKYKKGKYEHNAIETFYRDVIKEKDSASIELLETELASGATFYEATNILERSEAIAPYERTTTGFIKMKRILGKTNKWCKEEPVKFDDLINDTDLFRKSFQARVRTCFTAKGTNVSKEIQFLFKKESESYFKVLSKEFWKTTDRLGYIYRTLRQDCKWY